MKRSTFSGLLCSICFMAYQTTALAAQSPEGGITIYNASNHNVTAQLSSHGAVTLPSNATRSVSYSSLARACAANPTNCVAYFYIDNKFVGSAIINVLTGKLVKKALAMKVAMSVSQNILRTVVIK